MVEHSFYNNGSGIPRGLRDMTTDFRKLSVGEVKFWLDGIERPLVQEEELSLSRDDRAGVRGALKSFLTRRAKFLKLQNKFEVTTSYERKAYRDGCSAVAGVDEAGRGPLAGPVVAAAVTLDLERPILGLDDSKKLSPRTRATLYEEIMNKAVGWAVGIAGPEVIDRINILEATRQAMRDAIAGLSPGPDLVLVDAMTIRGLSMRQIPLVMGESKSASIAAASIVAKVFRDRLMLDLDREYPQYGFSSNKGYGTADHLEALSIHGPSPVHRLSFARVLPDEPAD